MSEETRERVHEIGRAEFDGASADETIRRLLDEHWRASVVAAVEHDRINNPDGWAAYIAEADALSDADAPNRAHERVLGECCSGEHSAYRRRGCP